MDYGTHCDVCGQLDFLPFKCFKCGQSFCGSHRMHDCEEDVKPTVKEKTEANPAKQANSIAANKPRNPSIANKPVIPAKQAVPNKPERLKTVPKGSKPGNERALAALERFKQLVGVSSPKKATSPVSVEMKRSAVGDSSVVTTNRVYFNIQRPPQEYTDPLTKKKGLRPAKQVPMFFNKTQTVGQLLDRANKQLAISGKAITCNNEVIEFNAAVSSLVQGSTLEIQL